MASILANRTIPPKKLSDDELLRRLSELVQHSRRVESELVAHIGEVDARRLYERQACPSMFVYCTEVLHLSEAEAYLRIRVARAARQHTILLEMLRDGRLHLRSIAKLAPHLTESNREKILTRAVHRSKRQIEMLVAELEPRPDVPTVIRKLPQPRPAKPLGSTALPTQETQLCPGRVQAVAPIHQPEKSIEPLAPSRYKVSRQARSFTKSCNGSVQ